MMADSVPETSCSARNETAYNDEHRAGTFAETLECSDDNHPVQELTFMCSDTVAMSSGALPLQVTHSPRACWRTLQLQTMHGHGWYCEKQVCQQIRQRLHKKVLIHVKGETYVLK